MTRLDTAQESLKQGGLRMTSTRHAILQLMSDEGFFYTIEQLAEQAGERRMDTVTVYRIMQAFEELGLVHKLLSVNGFVTIDPSKKENYCFYVDQETQKVVRTAVEISKLVGFKEHTQYVEVVGSFTTLEELERVENLPKGVHKSVEQKPVAPKLKIQQEEEASMDSSKQIADENRQQKKKLHQKLREF